MFCSRSNSVNDLLKLAKQFDFMFHQDVEEEEQHPELLSQDIFQPDADPAEADLPMDDDLDFLFDGATQQVSGALSPAPSGASSSSLRSYSAADVKETLASDGFEDDWEDNDLLNELLEMTQKITSPKFCSTQKPAGCEGGHQFSAGIRLDSSPAVTIGRVQMSLGTRQNRVLSGPAVGSERTWPATQGAQQEPAGGSSSAVPHQNVSPRNWKPAGTDPVWDDPVDDQLLCELCEDLEKQLQEERLNSTQQRTNRNLLPPRGCSSEVPVAVSDWTGFQFNFKKPVDPVTFRDGTVGAGTVPCSAAEIEQKKQWAIQRRRRRLQLAQGRGAPT